MLIGLLWPLAVVSFWFVVFLLAIFLARRFTREPDAAPSDPRDGVTPMEAHGALPSASVGETGAGQTGA